MLLIVPIDNAGGDSADVMTTPHATPEMMT
jgi:hypothetical protein